VPAGRSGRCEGAQPAGHVHDPIPPEPPVTLAAKAITSTSVTLSAELNPKAKAAVPVEYDFAYNVSATECTGGTVTPEAPVKATGKPKEPVTLPVTALQPNTEYTYCALALNAAAEQASGLPVTFKTSAIKPTIDSEAASAASSTAITLEAQVNPNNQETSFTFEYSTEGKTGAGEELKGTIAPLPGAAALPSGFGDQLASAATTIPLTAGTVYFYRLSATNGAGTTTGPVQSFTTVATPATDEPKPVAASTATLNGHLTLNATDTTYSFAYAPGSECAGAGAVSTTPVDAGTGSTQTSATTDITGLTPHTQYTVCLVTANAFGSQQGPPVSFTTLVAVPAITEQHSSEVAGTSAKLGALIDPGGAETTYHFEYDTTPYTTNSPHGTPTPSTPLLASDNTLHTASAPLEGLETGTEYHFRLVASNSAGTEYGPDTTFRTQGPGGPLALPDGRQYQLVSPANKDGAQVFGITAENGVVIGGSSAVQASEDGSAITYLASAPASEPAETHPTGNAASSQLLSRRQPSGWATRDISAAHGEPANLHYENGEPFREFSSTLSTGVLQENVNFPSQAAIVLRDNEAGTSQTLNTAGLPQPVEFEAATPDMKHLILSGEGGVGLYEWASGIATQVNVLEHNEPVPGAFLGGYKFVSGTHKGPSEFAGRRAVSDDGSRVVWGTATRLFSRDMVTEETVQLDAGPEGSGGGVFQLASSDGTRVFFTDETPLTVGALPGSLYMFNLLAAPGSQLIDLGPVGILRGGELGDEVLGADAAGTSVYVTSESVLSNAANAGGETAAPGGGNIFLLHETPGVGGSWSVSFVATLSAEDEAGYKPHPTEAKAHYLAYLPVRVSGDGEFLAFMSDRRLAFQSARGLTTYDNRDAVSGVPDEEVFLYSAASSGVTCASCDPTGARPAGELDTGAYPGSPMDQNREWRGHWLAAAIPPWDEALHISFGFNGRFDLSVYASRVLSDAGRLFFDSVDSLVPQDVNGREDVYEFEPGGLGSCAPSASGCVGLISSGEGTGSAFVDASVSGEDVFFVTAQRLVPADRDPASDMYDAHVCSGGSCLPVSGAVSAPCDSTDACLPAQAIQPGVFGAPPSATFSGVGNLASVPHVVVRLTASQLRAKALARELRVCHRKRGRRRAACEALARRRHGPVGGRTRRARRASRAGNLGSLHIGQAVN
jgi:hypothetical protein